MSLTLSGSAGTAAASCSCPCRTASYPFRVQNHIFKENTCIFFLWNISCRNLILCEGNCVANGTQLWATSSYTCRTASYLFRVHGVFWGFFFFFNRKTDEFFLMKRFPWEPNHTFVSYKQLHLQNSFITFYGTKSKSCCCCFFFFFSFKKPDAFFFLWNISCTHSVRNLNFCQDTV